MSYINFTKLIPNIELKEVVNNPSDFKKKLESLVSSHFNEEEYVENSFIAFKTVLNSLTMLYSAVPAGYHTEIKLCLKDNSGIKFNLRETVSKINFGKDFASDDDTQALVYDKNKDFGSAINIDNYEFKKSKYHDIMPLHNPSTLHNLLTFYTGTCEKNKANSSKRNIDYLVECIGNDIIQNNNNQDDAMNDLDSIYEKVMNQMKQVSEKKTVLEFENLKTAFLNEYSKFIHDYPHVAFYLTVENKNKKHRQDFFGYMPHEFQIELVKDWFFDAPNSR